MFPLTAAAEEPPLPHEITKRPRLLRRPHQSPLALQQQPGMTITKAVPWIVERKQLLQNFMSPRKQQPWPLPTVQQTPQLAARSPPTSQQQQHPMAPRTALVAIADDLESQALAATSHDSVEVGQRRFAGFLQKYNIKLGKSGISDADLRLFVAYLYNEEKITSYNTISAYMSSGVRTWHLMAGLDWIPIDHRPSVKAVMAGARRLMGPDTGKNKKLPITLQMLMDIRATLDMNNARDRAWWSAALTAFYCLLRKANLCEPPACVLQKRAARGNLPPATICRHDVMSGDNNTLWLQLRSTKTIQNGERILMLPLPQIRDNPLCPVQALKDYLSATNTRPPASSLYGWYQTNGDWHSMTYADFTLFLKQKLREIGINPAAYSGHSFRRGGATFAFAFGALDPLVIKALGDWISSAFMEYCEVQNGLRRAGAERMAEATQRLFPPHNIIVPRTRPHFFGPPSSQ